jgi:thiol:disulfide interchange protein DsbA
MNMSRLAFAAALIAVAGAAASAFGQTAAPVGKWQLGRQYQALNPAVSTSVGPGKVEVVEIFWYGCGACYTLDPYLESWKKTAPAHVEFVRLPVTWNAGAKLHARLFYTLRALKQDARLHAKVFDTIHRGGNNLLGRDEASTLELQTAWAKQNGIDPKAFSDAWNSMAVATRLRQADDLLRRYKPGGTPFMVINGRYTTDIQLAGGIPPMLEMINDLAAAEKRR